MAEATRVGVADGSQAHEESAVFELLQHILRHRLGQPGFADARRPQQSDQPCAVGEQPFAHGGDVVLAANEWGELRLEVMGAARLAPACLAGACSSLAPSAKATTGQIGIDRAHGLGQGRGQWRRGVKVAGFDLAQSDLGAARLLRQILLGEPKDLAALLEPLAKGCRLTQHVSSRSLCQQAKRHQ